MLLEHVTELFSQVSTRYSILHLAINVVIRLGLHPIKDIVIYCTMSAIIGKVIIHGQLLIVLGGVWIPPERLHFLLLLQKTRSLEEVVEWVELFEALLFDVKRIFKSTCL